MRGGVGRFTDGENDGVYFSSARNGYGSSGCLTHSKKLMHCSLLDLFPCQRICSSVGLRIKPIQSILLELHILF